jgi:peptide methionine sulfoxide reductase msrA/msrB
MNILTKLTNKRITTLYRLPLIAVFFAGLALVVYSSVQSKDDDMGYNELTPKEKSVIIDKGTERPYTGIYYDHWEKGTYICKRCDTPLYRSTDKFESHCGWPSFDDEIPGAVERKPDADGIRTEILCANCGAHLGHVFTGEGYTDKNVRHCVNSISMKFVPDKKADKTETYEKAYFAGGCFWGVEYYFEDAEGVISTTVGFMGGNKDNPTYKDVSYTKTGHAETVEVVYDPEKTTYEKMAKLFFEIHDPTQVNRQGPDIGEQYRSVVFYTDENQKKIAEKLIGILENKGYKVATQVVKAGQFWEAEDYHQDYYEKNHSQPYCHVYQKKF